MQPSHRTPLPLLVAASLLASACYQSASGEDANIVTRTSDQAAIPTATPMLVLPAPVILSVDTPAPAVSRPDRPTPTPTPSRPDVPTATPTPDAPATQTPVATATELPAPTTTATPGATPPIEVPPPTVEATPFTDADLVAAMVARGLAYTPQQPRVGCTGRAADVRHLDAPDGPPLTLWTYPTSDDLKADWILPSSGAPRPTIANCTVDGGWIYWYENLVIAFEPQDEWIPQGSIRESIVAAFFSLSR